MKSLWLPIMLLCFTLLPKNITEKTTINLDFAQSLTDFHEKHAFEKIYLHIDRPMYEVGEDIWFAGYLVNANNQPNTQSHIVYVELLDPKGSSIQKHKLVSLDGKFHGDFKLGEEVAGGMYTVRAWTQWMQNFGQEAIFTKTIQVQKSVLPRLLMKMDFVEKAYGAGDQVRADVTFNTLENRPLANQPYRFVANLQGVEYLKGEGTTDAEGKTQIQFDLPDYLPNNDGLLNVMIDYQGQNESIARSIPIVLNTIDLQFFPEGGNLVENTNSRIAFKALNEFGKPADIAGKIFDKSGKEVAFFESYHQGMGSFYFTPKAGQKYTAKITRPFESKQKIELPKSQSSGVVMRMEKDDDQTLRILLNSSDNQNTYLVGQVGEQLFYEKNVSLKTGQNEVKVDLQDFPVGIARFTLFNENETIQAERIIFVNQERELEVNISTDKEKYQPREKATVNISVKDETGKPVQGNFSMAVVDDKLLSFADDRQDHIQSYLLMSSELKGKIEEPQFYFDKKEEKAPEALDLVMMTHGWRGFEWQEILEKVSIQKFVIEPEQAVIKGKVVDYKTKKPIKDAEVCLFETGETVLTNAFGHFEFVGVDLSLPVTLKAQFDENNSRVYSINEYVNDFIVEKSQTLKGLIKDGSSGEGLPFCTVSTDNVNPMVGTQTDFDGYFTLNHVPIGSTILVQYIGYESVRFTYTGDTEFVDVEMREDVSLLDEVVVTSASYGRKAKGLFNRKGKTTSPTESRVVMRNSVQPTVNKNTAIKETQQNKDKAVPPPPPPPPPALVVVEDEEVLIESEVELKMVEEVIEEEAEWEEMEEPEPEPEIFTIVEEMPEFEGGQEKMLEFIYENLSYPQIALDNQIEGMVVASFMVAADGSIQKVQVRRDIGGGCGQEAVKVLEQMPNWKPGKQRGKPVTVQYNLPIRFKLDNGNGESVPAHSFDLDLQFAQKNSFSLKPKKPQYNQVRTFYSPQYQSKEMPKVRHDFRKTLYWNPMIELDEQGKAQVSFYNSDEISQYKIILEGLTGKSVVRQEQNFFTQLPFSLDAKIPPYLTFEDELQIPIILKNNTDEAITGKLRLQAPKSTKLLEALPEDITIEPNSIYKAMTTYRILPQASQAHIGIQFTSDGFEDAMVQKVDIRPKGFPAQQSFSGDKMKQSFDLELRDVVDGSLDARFVAYPNILDEMMGGVEGIFREPHGCFEQTSSYTYPNVLALNYLKTTNQVRPEIKKKALEYIDKGYKRLKGFETKEHGFEWYGGTPPHEGLTAYGLMEFTDMNKVFPVSQALLKRTTEWLMSRRDGQGGFKKNERARRSYGYSNPKVLNAYVTYALSEAGITDIETELNATYDAALSDADAYRLALVANTAFNLQQSKKGEKMLQMLLDLVKEHGYHQLPAEMSITSSRGQSLAIETTALLMMASLKSPNPDASILAGAAEYLLSKRRYGMFGSTQGTVLALKALIGYAQFMNKTDEGGTVQLLAEGKVIQEFEYAKHHKGKIELTGWANNLQEGKQTLKVQFKDTKQALPYSIDLGWTTNTPVNDPDCALSLQTNLLQSNARVGETVRLQTIVENIDKQAVASPIAKIGIPSGLSVQPWQLKELVEKEQVAFYEIWHNYLVLYWRGMEKKDRYEINLDLKAEVPGYFEAPASSAYLYYTDEFKNWAEGASVEVSGE